MASNGTGKSEDRLGVDHNTKGKRGRPRLKEIELNTENKQAILDYIKQGYEIKDIAKELNTTVKPVRKVYNRYLKEVEEVVELDRVDKIISDIIETTVDP